MQVALHKAFFRATLAVTLTATLIQPQTNSPTNDEYLKSLLSEYYTGRIVRARVAIPASRKGLEVIDGQLRAVASRQTIAANPGDPLLIALFNFKNKRIEVEFKGSEAEPDLLEAPLKKDFAANSKKLPAPRLSLQFSRDITTRDLNIQTINRLLSVAVDVSTLNPQPAEQRSAANEETRRRLSAREIGLVFAERRAAAQGIPTAPLRDNTVVAGDGIAELTIECNLGQARLYVDGDFSGQTPRTIRTMAGVHTILLIRDGAEAWEKQFFLTAGKAFLVRAELQPARPAK